jgi:hypothetical protein
MFTPCSTLHGVKFQKEGHHLKHLVSLRFKRQVLLGKPRCWEGSVKTGFVGTQLEDVDWVHLAQNRSREHAVVSTAMKMKGCIKGVEFVE